MMNSRTRSEAGFLRLLALVAVAVGIAILAVAVYFVLTRKPSGGETEIPVPREIADFALTRKSTGTAAISEINQMHGLEFSFLEGVVCEYGTGRKATLWVSVLADREEAEQMLTSMRDRIAAGNSPFQPLGVWQNRERSIYELQGMGQRHYYFQSDQLVVWLAVEPPSAQVAIDYLLDFYP
jgi:hypothetical protein